MGTTKQIDPPFGTFALAAKRERLRAKASQHSNVQFGRWMISWFRKRAIKNLPEPFDIEVAPHVKARLYPSTNRCEKRAVCGVQIWDTAEREALRQSIEAATNGPFIFLDIGANVGLYSLFAQSYARAAGQDIRLIAVEPSSEMRARLSDNAAASDAAIELVSTAIATRPGKAFLSDGGGNRREGRLAHSGEAITAMTLMQLCAEHKIHRIDALKLDIEGQDLAVLTQFFEQAPTSLHPHMMILELDAESERPLIELIEAHAYLILKRTRMNIVVQKRDQT